MGWTPSFPSGPSPSGTVSDGQVEPDPVAEGTIPEQLLKRAREAADRHRRSEAIQIYRQLLTIEPGQPAGAE